jgi:hypothetical protein
MNQKRFFLRKSHYFPKEEMFVISERMEVTRVSVLLKLNFSQLEQQLISMESDDYISLLRYEKISRAVDFARQKAQMECSSGKEQVRRKMKDAVDTAQSNCNKYKLNFELAIFAEKRLTFLGHVACTREVYIVHLDSGETLPAMRERRTHTRFSLSEQKTRRIEAKQTGIVQFFSHYACKIHASAVEKMRARCERERELLVRKRRTKIFRRSGVFVPASLQRGDIVVGLRRVCARASAC